MSDTIEMVELKPTQLVPHKKNIRTALGDLADLTASVKAKGVLQALVVVPNGKPDRYVILAGHRRHAAAKAAKLPLVPCIVRHDLTDEADQIAVMIGENIERSDLTAVEEATGVQELLDLGDSPKMIATRTGMSAARVRQRSKIAKLSDEVKGKLSEHAVTLADAAFIAEHAGAADDLAELEQALGTNNWAFAKERVTERVEKRKKAAKLRKDAADHGLAVVENWDAFRARRRTVADHFGVKSTDLVETECRWPAPAVMLEKAIAAPECAVVFLKPWGEGASLYVFAAPSDALADPDAPRPAADTDTSSEDADDAVDEDGLSQHERNQRELERQNRQKDERRAALATATTVRRAFIQDVVTGGKLEHARLAAQFAPAVGSYIEISWDSLLPYLPAEDPHPESPQTYGDIAEDRAAAVAAWIDTQPNPYVLCLALAWMFASAADVHLERGNVAFLDTEELDSAQRYIVLLETLGYQWSDIEQSVVDDVREAIAEEEDAAGED